MASGAKANDMNLISVLDILGLSLDIVGVVLLFCFGLPPKVATQGMLTLDGANPKKKRLYGRLSRLALSFLVAGFALQIWARVLS